MKKTAPIFVLFLVFFSCKDEIPLTFSEINFTSEEHAIIEINIPGFVGNEEVAEKMNRTLENHIIDVFDLNENTAEAVSLKDAYAHFNAEFLKFSEEISEDSQPWEAFIDGEVTYQSPDVICVAINAYTNTGGAHGNNVISFLNFDPSNGKLFENENIIKDLASFRKLAEMHFNRMLEERDEADRLVFEFPETIGLSEEGVIILLNSNGLIIDSPEFTIPYEEANEFLLVN